MLTQKTMRNVAVFACLSLGTAALAQDAAEEKHGRKYKAPPESTHIVVEVLKGYNGKPIPNAAVIFHPVNQDGKDQGNLEMKTGPDGKAIIDVIPIGSNVRVQVIASGFTTFGAQYEIATDSKEIQVKMERPQEQISTYEDNTGKLSQRQPGIQEQKRASPATSQTPPAASPTAPLQTVPSTPPMTPAAPSTAPNQ